MLDREPRPDGRAHRRLGHRCAGYDADRSGIPAAARLGDCDPARGRGGHRRLQHSVRGQPPRRPADRHRDEPASIAVKCVGVQGNRVSDRQDRRETGHRIHARRDRQRHHQGNAGLLRTHPGLRRGQGAAVRLREVSGRRCHADHHHEIGGRGDVVGPQLRRGARQGDAFAGNQPGRVLDRRRSRRRPRRRPDQAANPDRRPALRPGTGAAAGGLGRSGGRGQRRGPVVCRADRRAGRFACRIGRRAGARRGSAAPRQTQWAIRSADRLAAARTGRGRWCALTARAAGHPPGVQDGGHLCRRVRGQDSVPLQQL